MAAASASETPSNPTEAVHSISQCYHCQAILWHHQSCAAFHDSLKGTNSICTCGGKQVIHHALCKRPRDEAAKRSQEDESEPEKFDMESSFRKLPRLSIEVVKALEPLAAWLDECEENFDSSKHSGAWFDDMQQAVRAYIHNKKWRPMT